MALVVLTGGARSGKSAAAQALARKRELDGSPVCVVVFGRDGRGDAEFDLRVARHRAERPETWRTLEATDAESWLAQLPTEGVVLLDCLGTLLGLVMGELMPVPGDGSDGGSAAPDARVDVEALETRFDAVIGALASRVGDTIVVTNEVGDGVVPAFESGRAFRDVLGRANRRLVSAADAAYLCVCGRLISLEALPVEAAWPID